MYDIFILYSNFGKYCVGLLCKYYSWLQGEENTEITEMREQ